MKSIEDILKLIDSVVKSISKLDKVNIALIGGYSAIAHGVERTTRDVDFCIYTDTIHEKDTSIFTERIRNALPDNFAVKLIKGSQIMDDPFKHDIIFVHDKSGEYPRIDIIIARYKWELEGIKSAKPLKDIPFPVLPKPYLIAMKLNAGGAKDDYDVIELYDLLTEKEKKKAHELAKLIHMDKKLLRLTRPRKIKKTKEDNGQLI